MGKAQSKRSVDITTDPKKDGIVDEGTGEMKKIEDVDQLKPQVNGDTHHSENEEKEKVTENGETENEKDLSTEKENQKSQEGTSVTVSPDTGAGGDVPGSNVINDNTATSAATVEQQTTDANETLNDSNIATELTTSAETPESSSKKPKKEKVKKKWSFRSISFGKKDKQKPSKKEDTANTSAVNGECEKVPEETTPEEVKTTEEKKDVSSSVAEVSIVSAEASKVSTEENNSTTLESEVKVEKLEAPTITTELKSDDVSNGLATETKTVESAKISEELVSLPEEKEQPSVTENAPSSNDTETVETDQKSHEEIKTSSLTNGIEHHDVEEPKLNGSAESPKIEVKSEEKSSVVEQNSNSEIQNNEHKETEIILSSEIENAINNVQISVHNSNIVSKDDDNDPLNPINKLCSSPPPPLPCSPPPSQVMVFALSETKQEQQPVLDEILKTEGIIDLKEKSISNILVENIDVALSNVIPKLENLAENVEKTLLNETENVGDFCKTTKLQPETNATELNETTVKENNQMENSTEIGNAASEVIATNIVEEKLIAEALHNLNTTENLESEKLEGELREKILEPNEEKIIIDPNVAANVTEILVANDEATAKKSEDNITEEKIEMNKPESTDLPQIAENSELQNKEPIECSTLPIDEVVKPEDTADEIVKQEDTMSTAIFDNNINEIVETIALIEEYTDTVASASKELIESVTTEINNEELANTEENRAPLCDEKQIENVSITNSTESKQSDVEQDLSVSIATPLTVPETKENLEENKSETNDEINLNPSTTTSPESVISSVTESKTDNSDHSDSTISENTTSTSQNVQETEKDITAAATTNSNAPNQKKENGIGENHDEMTEVSATESVNGVDHKTIEEIKTENQQIDKVAGTEVVTQGATATVAE